MPLLSRIDRANISYKNPKFDDFINWRNKNLKIILFDVDDFIRKLGLIFKLGQLTGYLVRNISMEKAYRKHALKSRCHAPLKFVSAIF